MAPTTIAFPSPMQQHPVGVVNGQQPPQWGLIRRDNPVPTTNGTREHSSTSNRTEVIKTIPGMVANSASKKNIVISCNSWQRAPVPPTVLKSTTEQAPSTFTRPQYHLATSQPPPLKLAKDPSGQWTRIGQPPARPVTGDSMGAIVGGAGVTNSATSTVISTPMDSDSEYVIEEEDDDNNEDSNNFDISFEMLQENESETGSAAVVEEEIIEEVEREPQPAPTPSPATPTETAKRSNEESVIFLVPHQTLVTKRPDETANRDALYPLEWHIQRAKKRLKKSALSLNRNKGDSSGLVELEITRGRITQTNDDAANGISGDASGDLIKLMSRTECELALEYDMNWINRRLTEDWKPMVRAKRLRSADAVSSTVEVASSLKRKWSSMNFDLELDPTKTLYKRHKSLLCEESIVEQSSDDFSEGDQSDGNAEVILMPPIAELDDMMMNQDDLFAGMDIKAEPMTVGEDPLEETKDKVRECFRPSEGGQPLNGFEFINWGGNVGSLFGSSLSFFVNEYGLMDLTLGVKEEEPDLEYEERLHDIRKRNNRRQILAQDAATMKADEDGSFWSQYMESRGSFAAPAYMFRHIMGKEHHLRVGMQLELIDPENLCQTTRGVVAEDLGGRVAIQIKNLGLRYYNKNSWKLFPVGFSRETSMATSGKEVEKKSLLNYENKELVRQTLKWKSRFQKNWQVEALDWQGSGALRPATIRKIIRNRILVVFDGDLQKGNSSWVPKSSYWCTEDSPLIRPINYHVQAKVPFAPPHFPWGKYLKSRKTTAAPNTAFSTRPKVPFCVGMQLEAVDRINPHVLRPATVLAVNDFEIKIVYDTFPNGDTSYAMWTWDDSEDLFPVRWSLRHNHKLVTPDWLPYCVKRFCRDVGNRNRERNTHTSLQMCPYRMPDFFHDKQIDAELAARFTRFPKMLTNRQNKVQTGMSGAVLSGGSSGQTEDKRDAIIAVLEERLKKKSILLNNCKAVVDYGPTLKHNYKYWKNCTKLLMGRVDPKNPILWTCAQVEEYIDAVPNCRHLGGVFAMNEIDGEALLSMTMRDLSDVLNLKQGVVIKIHNAIVRLRASVIDAWEFAYRSNPRP